jgi:hypothetical protein
VPGSGGVRAALAIYPLQRTPAQRASPCGNSLQILDAALTLVIIEEPFIEREFDAVVRVRNRGNAKR